MKSEKIIDHIENYTVVFLLMITGICISMTDLGSDLIAKTTHQA